MALQGDLESFALTDVLRLLGSTQKTGTLTISASGTTGELWMDSGALTGGEVSTSPHAQRPAEVVFEVLRLDGGSFLFDEGDRSGGGERCGIDDAIREAEALVAEWEDVERVVPSVDLWVTMVPEIEGDGRHVGADQWRTLAALGGGATVRELADRFELTDLTASHRVKDLVEAGMVELGDAPARAERADEPEPASAMDDLAVLRADEGPIVLETRDDALLPEPLPGEGTTFAGDMGGVGAVDGREAEDAPEHGFGEPPLQSGPTGGFTDFAVDVPPAHAGAAPSYGEPSATGEPAEEPGTDGREPEAEAEASEHDDRGSLLNFLSTVKP